MDVQVLVATMNQKDHSLLKRMNIQSDAIIGNQCNFNSIEQFKINDCCITYLNFNERGVGLNRNNALMRAQGKYCLFADDDMVYEDNYVDIVVSTFNDIPDADVIIFNLKEKKPNRFVIKKISKVNYFNYLRYGTARIAIRLKSIKDNGIYFNQCFGGGSEYCHGEDNLFLTECLNKGLNVYSVPIFIATLTEGRESSWNNGYDDKYLKDQGKLYYTISKRWWRLLCIQDAVRHRKIYKRSVIEVLRLMFEFTDM